MVTGNKNSKQANVADTRLILQDPRAWEQAQTPSPRLSRELLLTNETAIDRTVAGQTWEALQLQTEDVVALRAQLKQKSLQLESSEKNASISKSETNTLRAQLLLNEEQRLHHPLVYGLGAVTLGAGLLWILERRRRIATAPPRLLPVIDTLQGVHVPGKERIEQESHSPGDTSELERQDIHFLPPDPWWQRLWPRKHSTDSIASSMLPIASQAAPRSTQFMPESVFSSAEESCVETEIFDPEYAQIDLFSQTRLKPASADDGMIHLLELRMASQALCALEQPHMAQRLLEQHIDAVPNTCAWAYLEYLQLCTELNQRDAFEAMRMRYRTHFNRLAPYWNEPKSNTQNLDGYERPLGELCAAWPTERAKILINTWLLGTLHARRLFQLPAYHDLLDLYELLEHMEISAQETLIANKEDESIEFVPTVNLLDLDFEFATDVKLQAQSARETMRAVPTIKTGDFAVDVNITQSASQPAALFPQVDNTTLAKPATSL